VSIRHLLPQTCTIQTKTVTGADALGHEVYSWANTHTGVPCRLYTLSGTFARERFKEADIGENTLFLALLPDQGIDREARVVVDGETYEVSGPPSTHRGYAAANHKTVPLRPYQ